MSRVVISLAIALLGLSSNALAALEQLSFVPQNPTSADVVQAVLTGQANCYFVFVPTVSRSGSLVVLSSSVNAPSPGGGGCGGAVTPYTQSVQLGVLPSGTYTVTWHFTPAVVAPITQQLVVTNAAPIPGLSRIGLGVLASLLALFAIGFLRLRATDDA
jgi:hypothetical protein